FTLDEGDPKPISLEFDVIRIFPICGYIVLVATLIFITEFIYYYGVRREGRALAKARLSHTWHLWKAFGLTMILVATNWVGNQRRRMRMLCSILKSSLIRSNR